MGVADARTAPANARSPIWRRVVGSAAVAFAVATVLNPAAGGIPMAVAATTITVTTTEDELNSDGDCSLREAIAAANRNVAVDACPAGGSEESDVLDLLPGLYALSIAGAGEDAGETGDLDATGDLHVRGAGASATVIDGNLIDRVFHLHSVSVIIEGLTIQHGSANGFEEGGGVLNLLGRLTLRDALVRGNLTGFSEAGGVLNSGGMLAVVDSRIADNENGGLVNENYFSETGSAAIVRSVISGNEGFGVHNRRGGIATVSASTIENNRGNGLYNDNTSVMTVDTTTVSHNIAGIGGAGILNADAALTVINSTVSANVSMFGGGGGILQSSGVPAHAVVLRNVTIAGNRARESAGGIAILRGEVRARHTIIAGSRDTTAGSVLRDCIAGHAGSAGVLVSEGYNLIENPDGCPIEGDLATLITGQDPRLGPLADNGGPTRTHALAPGSPAIDGADPAGCTDSAGNPFITDQRGTARPIDGDGDETARCDIGAFESAFALTVSAIRPDRGGSGGAVTAIVSGTGFAPGALVKLARNGEAEIVGSPVEVRRDGLSVAASFDLTGMPHGPWDVIVSNPSGATAILPGAFVVDEGRPPQIWLDILGRDLIRTRLPAPFRILIGNRGDTDIHAVAVVIAVPESFTRDVRFPITAPPEQPGQVPTDWGQIGIEAISDEPPGQAVIPLLLPIIPAGATEILELELTGSVQGPFTIQVWSNGSIVDTAAVDSLMESVQEFVREAFGVEVPFQQLPEVERYLTTALDQVVAHGSAKWVAELGADREVYSQTQLFWDLARFAEARAKEPAAQVVREIGRRRQGAPGLGDSVPALRVGTAAGAAGIGCKGLAGCNSELNRELETRGGSVVLSRDPNDKVASAGAQQTRYLSGEEPLRYAVFFENVEDATAAARDVVVTDQLPLQALDLDTLALGPIAIGRRRVTPPAGSKAFTAELDLRPENDVLVRIDARLDAEHGVVTWSFASLDPRTGLPPDDPATGFLPPNAHPPEGEGSVLFTVMPRAGLSSGTEICNRAEILFDANEAIVTPQRCNTLDNDTPESSVLPLEPVQTPRFELRWAGSDATSGVLDYTIYASADGGPFAEVFAKTTQTSATFTGAPGTSYAFYSVARDRTGNREHAPAVADAVTLIGAGCVGDCNRDGMVRVDELVTGVNIALAAMSIDACPAFDANVDTEVTVNELVQAVNNALNGCQH